MTRVPRPHRQQVHALGALLSSILTDRPTQERADPGGKITHTNQNSAASSVRVHDVSRPTIRQIMYTTAKGEIADSGIAILFTSPQA